ncbi:MAG TPA: BT_3928 family protein [Paludibacter sp.]|nr:BT_3928 family protein [Paludibacter sp.]
METNSSNIKKGPGAEKAGSILLEISRILLGCVFVFSGFVKAIDPLGSTYKFDDYFRAFGGFFESFTHISFPLAILLSAIELIIGLNLILKVQFKITTFAALAFMAVMTPLTLYIALKKDLVTDCGCFGDALVISNWATFWKNILFSALVVVILIYQQKIRPYFVPKTQNVLLAAFVAFSVGLSIYCYQHLPLIDFLPYKVGVNIPASMIVPDNAPVDKYETTFIYEKNGQQKEFTLENYPKGDSTWKFVDQKSVLVSEGYKPKIHDFSIVTADFEDITEQVLYDAGYTYLFVMYDLNQASEKGAKAGEKLYQQSLKTGAKFYALTASSDEDVQAFKQKTGVTYPFCKTDPTALKTVIRANPGLMIIKNGTITGKWNWRDFE